MAALTHSLTLNGPLPIGLSQNAAPCASTNCLGTIDDQKPARLLMSGALGCVSVIPECMIIDSEQRHHRLGKSQPQLAGPHALQRKHDVVDGDGRAVREGQAVAQGEGVSQTVVAHVEVLDGVRLDRLPVLRDAEELVVEIENGQIAELSLGTTGSSVEISSHPAS
jgi:hypothetical protein